MRETWNWLRAFFAGRCTTHQDTYLVTRVEYGISDRDGYVYSVCPKCERGE